MKTTGFTKVAVDGSTTKLRISRTATTTSLPPLIGGTATAQNPTHTYATTGVKTWSVTATTDGQSSCTRSGTITIAQAAGDLELHDFTLNHGVTFSSGTWVSANIELRGASTGWQGGDVEVRLYFIDIKGVGHDSLSIFGWGDNNERARGYFVTHASVPALSSGVSYTVTLEVNAFAADYIDAAAVELVNADGTLINGVHKMLQTSLSVPFNSSTAGLNCIGTIITAVAPFIGGDWITTGKDAYD